MRMKLIYPTWPKLERQTVFHLPPHGPVVFAATVPQDVDIEFIDENVQEPETDPTVDLAALSVMLTSQLPRAFEIADAYRAAGVPVIFGGIATTLHHEEVAQHADSVFLGEAEGRFDAVLQDLRNGGMKPLYDYRFDHPEMSLIGNARRDILDRGRYAYKGVQMLDLTHASRGCRFNCFPCCVGYLGGKVHRPRPVDQFIEELEAIPNNRVFIVDNSLAQNREWLVDLFTAMAPLKKKFVAHPIKDDDEILRLAADAGCWYVYQAIFDTSDYIRDRVKRLQDHGIGVEGTIILGRDDHDVDGIKRLVDFLMEINLDLAEFTIQTPFPQSPVRAELQQQGRLLSDRWLDYTCDKVVFQPKLMTPDELQEMYYYAWDTFYADGGYSLKMGELFRKVVKREIADGTLRRYAPASR